MATASRRTRSSSSQTHPQEWLSSRSTPTGKTASSSSRAQTASSPPHHVEQEAERIAAAAVVCLCLESPLETVLAAARQGHQGGATVILNLSPFQEVPTDLLAVADLLLVNEHEAAQLLQSNDLALDWAATARGFKAAGVRDVIVTLGARGSMVIQSGPANLAVLTSIPAVPAHVVDTTGCGDAFTGALADSLARGVDLVAAARRAAAVASIAAAAEGAQDSYPTPTKLPR